MLNQASLQGQPLPGAWFVRAWYTGVHGNVLSNAQAVAIESQRGKLDTGTYEAGVKSYNSWLSTHHIVYTLADQPQARFWIFQLLAITILLVISTALVWLAVRVVDRRAA